MSYTSTAVKTAYNNRTYKRYALTLRFDEDQEIISRIEALVEAGMSASEAIKSLLKK